MTIIAFAKGYKKSAVTMFPKKDADLAEPAMIYLRTPRDWRDLYGDNTAEALTQDYMRDAYSREFGATKKEKAWMIEYTRANLWKSYTDSDIKGNKRYESVCGHDYSDVIVSTAGMQRNPAREKCADILREMGNIQDLKDNWMAHALVKKTWSEIIKELAKAAIVALPAEYNEPKLFEAEILSGIDQAGKAGNAVDATKTGYRNGLSEVKPEKKATLTEAQSLYNRGDRAGAYKTVGGTIYRALSSAVTDENTRIRLGEVSGKIKAGAAVNPENTGATLTEIENSLAMAGDISTDRLLAGIGQSLGGFHLLMNRPQTAAATGGDDGNHKDKPGYKVAESTEADKSEKTPTTQQRNSTTTTITEDDQYQAMGISEIIRAAKAEKARDTKERLAASLAKKTPSNTIEIGEMLDLLDTNKDMEGDVALRGAVKGAMRKIKDPSFAPVFAKKVKRGGVESRRVAIQKVAEFKYKEAVPDLIDMVKGLDDESAIRKMPFDEAYLMLDAFNALGDIGDERAIPIVWKKLGKLNGRDPEVIGKFGQKVLPQLIDATKVSKDDDEKDAAYAAINSIKDKNAIPVLWKTVQTEKDSRLRGVCAGALMGTLTKNTTPTYNSFVEYLNQESRKDEEMEYYALLAAYRRKDVVFIVSVLKIPDDLNKISAIRFLTELKDLSSVPGLEAALKDPDKEIRYRAAAALKKITGKDYSGGIK
ncbi:MAG: HEAT repeat domain-containing protein [Elusimicrobia bacterium]|nr:HEAT repeat domain-containing protein [Elusimicrobiota bacterium]